MPLSLLADRAAERWPVKSYISIIASLSMGNRPFSRKNCNIFCNLVAFLGLGAPALQSFSGNDTIKPVKITAAGRFSGRKKNNMSMNTVPERLAALREAMAANGVAVYLIPVGDPHASEYLPTTTPA